MCVRERERERYGEKAVGGVKEVGRRARRSLHRVTHKHSPNPAGYVWVVKRSKRACARLV